jgi:2-oxoglutarate dehydrogenase E2 component (dihydrolipoamide succinyltransferase)
MDGPIASLETGKATVDIKSTVSGKIIKLHAKVGQTVLVGNDFAIIDETQVGSTKAAPAPTATPTAAPAEAPKAPQPQEKKPEPKPQEPKVQAPEKKPIVPESVSMKEPMPAVKFSREVRRVPMSRLRQTASKRLKESQNTYAMLTTFNECDMSELTKLRKELGEDFFKTHNSRLGFMSAFVRASVMSLQKFPAINAVIDGKEIVFHDYVDMSIAVSGPKGLLVPVLRNCDSLGFSEVEKVIWYNNIK